MVVDRRGRSRLPSHRPPMSCPPVTVPVFVRAQFPLPCSPPARVGFWGRQTAARVWSTSPACVTLESALGLGCEPSARHCLNVTLSPATRRFRNKLVYSHGRMHSVFDIARRGLFLLALPEIVVCKFPRLGTWGISGDVARSHVRGLRCGDSGMVWSSAL